MSIPESPENPAQRQAAPLPAATVMLVRDAGDGIEVFLMKRSGHGSFGGLHVFPGGKVDGADRAERWTALANGPDDPVASRTLGMRRGGLGYWVACVRECFEEAGVLLAQDGRGKILGLASADARSRFSAWRDRLNAGESSVFETMCADEGLRLATDQLAYVSHWITPVDQPARFTTRFFVARAPAEQEALHDGHETVESEWIRPALALERFAAGELNLISPTQKNLEAIAGFSSTESLLEAKRRVDPASIPTIQPRIRARTAEGYDETLEIVGYGGRTPER